MRILIVFALIFGLMSFNSAYAADGVVNGVIDWNNGIIRSTGNGFQPNGITNVAQARFLARRAATLDAYRNLLETVNGIQIDADTTVSNAMISDNIRSRVSGIVKGGHIIEENTVDGGGYYVVVEIKLFGENSVAAAVLPDKPIQQFPQLAPQQVQQVQSKPDAPLLKGYTGVVIDATGIEVDRCMSPVIVDTTGRIVYGDKYLDTGFVTKYGMVSYIHDQEMLDKLNAGTSRAGANPLVIKAVGAKDFNRNMVISEDDANKILMANQQNDFLRKTSVVFKY